MGGIGPVFVAVGGGYTGVHTHTEQLTELNTKGLDISVYVSYTSIKYP